MSIEPSFFTIFSKTFLAAISSLTSSGKEKIFEFWPLRSLSNFYLLADAATFQPSLANFIAVAFPIPLLAPVIHMFFDICSI